ncbi:cation diffusion facilitator family transporter [Caballeronia udeis]|uniref:Cation diffusion facilitator family transporter n=1 Tax=Caballeronia udeis TaxID=1232866 RepID=A0A158JNK0_9BURK|nr:cation diffusion facilitator family transporter [Caballeronia udeis]
MNCFRKGDLTEKAAKSMLVARVKKLRWCQTVPGGYPNWRDHDCYLESKRDIPEPHAFKAVGRLPHGEHEMEFEEPEHRDDAYDSAARDHNIGSASQTGPLWRACFSVASLWHASFEMT